MADIQPKNTNTIHVDVIKEKTASAGTSFSNTTKLAAAAWVADTTLGNLTGDASLGGDIVFQKAGAGVVHTVSAAITAAGANQAGATAITTQINVITTCTASSAEGVRLPALTSALIGKPFWVCNEAAGDTAKVYPAGSNIIDDLSASAAYSLANNTHKMFMPITTTRWLSF